jgi:hypothetical protein
VPHTLPASRDTVEKSAAAKASVSPTRANRNRTQTCDSRNHGKRETKDDCELSLQLSEFTVRLIVIYQHMAALGRVEVTEETFDLS